jgi:hypothetical protein
MVLSDGAETHVIYRKSLVQIKIRVREDLLAKIRKAAKKNNRPVTEEVAALLRSAFEDAHEREKWQQERENWIVAIRAALESSPKASEMALLKLKEIDDQAEREAMNQLMQDLNRQPS